MVPPVYFLDYSWTAASTCGIRRVPIITDKAVDITDTMNDNAWDDLFANPHQSAHELGCSEGHIGGLHQGFVDGQKLGTTKGVEYGMELGFLKGILYGIEMQRLPAVELEKQEKVRTSVKELQHMIQTFPSPEELFHVNDAERMDIATRLQRIRAKYKLLTVQLHIPYITLKDVMNHPTSSGESSEW